MNILIFLIKINSIAIIKKTITHKVFIKVKPEPLKYFPSMYDPIIINKYVDLYKINGFIKNHKSVVKKLPSKLFFGNFSIMSLNGRLERDTLEEKQEKMLKKLIDSHHPTVLLLQSMSKDVMKNIEIIINGHYKICADRFIDIDRISLKNEFKPIIYDSNIIEVEMVGNFSPPLAEETTSFATFSTFKILKTNTRFTVINVDLYSADAETVETQLFTIMKHIHDSWISKYPIIIGGTINEKTNLTKKFLEKAFKDLIKSDRNNLKLSSDTFHNNGTFYDGISRDFLLLRDENHKFILNYARILQSFDTESFKHYPIYAILTIKP